MSLTFLEAPSCPYQQMHKWKFTISFSGSNIVMVLKARVALIHFTKSQHDSEFKYCHLFAFFILTCLFLCMNKSSEQMVGDYQ